MTLLIGWYTPSGGSYVRNGGHFVAVLGQDRQTNILTIGNPCPSTLEMVPDEPRHARQKLTTSTFNGASPDLPEQGIPYLQFPDMVWLGSSQAVTPVLETVLALTVDTSQRSGPTPSPWTLAAQQSVDTNDADFTVLAPLTGAGGLAQAGAGDLILEGSNTTSGSNAISGGSFSGPGSTTPSGAVAIGSGRLVLNPGGAGSKANVALPGGVSFSGAAELELVAGKNDSLAVTLGAQGGSQGLAWIDAGTLTIIVDRGLAQLGQACTLTAPGGIGDLLQSPIVSPSIVAKRHGAADGDFLTYGSAGFVLPAYTSSKSTNINGASASDVYLVDNDQILDASADVTVCALNVGRHALSAAGPNAVLNISPQAAGGRAGLILNTATLSGFQLNFGASNAAIYLSGTSQVGAVIAGSGRLTVFGPGALSLTGANVYTGETLVQSGSLEVSAGSGTGSGSVLVQGTGRLGVAGTVSGEILAEQGGTIVLAGGGAAGGISVDGQSNSERLWQRPKRRDPQRPDRRRIIAWGDYVSGRSHPKTEPDLHLDAVQPRRQFHDRNQLPVEYSYLCERGRQHDRFEHRPHVRPSGHDAARSRIWSELRQCVLAVVAQLDAVRGQCRIWLGQRLGFAASIRKRILQHFVQLKLLGGVYELHA